jgi:hypothetical protein
MAPPNAKAPPPDARGRRSEIQIPSDNGFSFNGSVRLIVFARICKSAARLIGKGGGHARHGSAQ